jgi:hypothetical protein
MCLSFEDARGGLLVVKMSPGHIFDKFAVEDSKGGRFGGYAVGAIVSQVARKLLGGEPHCFGISFAVLACCIAVH